MGVFQMRMITMMMVMVFLILKIMMMITTAFLIILTFLVKREIGDLALDLELHVSHWFYWFVIVNLKRFSTKKEKRKRKKEKRKRKRLNRKYFNRKLNGIFPSKAFDFKTDLLTRNHPNIGLFAINEYVVQ